MKIAISGSHGLIGSALAKQLAATGHTTAQIVRTAPGEPPVDEGKIGWNPESGLLRPAQLNDFDAVVHLAGRSIASARWTDEEKKRIRDSRVLPTQVLSEQIASLDSPPRVIVSASATGFYGDCGTTLVDEATSQGTDFLARVAGDWERACEPLRQAGLRVVNPRLGIVLDHAGGALAKMLPIFRLGLGGRLGNGHQYWSWIGLPDCVSALCWLLENEQAHGAYNLTAPNPVTNGIFTQLLADTLKRPAVVPAPKFALRMALGEMADALLLSSCRALPTRLTEQEFQFQHSDLADCLTAILAPSQ